MQLKDKTVLITGGASGIGKIMSRLMLERSAKVIIWDINPKGIEETISEFIHLGVIAGYTVDVSDLEQIQETAKKEKEDLFWYRRAKTKLFIQVNVWRRNWCICINRTQCRIRCFSF